jgi:NAD(P)-dependent dehydrogenase (short-subunit alcohol dehydrogenase family)
MKEFKGRTALITGGASGIGLAMAEAFGREGMNVMIADIEETALAKAVEELRAKQLRAEAVRCDVTSRDSVRNAALATIAKFGKIHVLCNNAGVLVMGEVGKIPERDWRWIFDVNMKGVIYGVETVAPLIESHGEGGHIVNTASFAGMVAGQQWEPYGGTKFAVVAMSEGWRGQLAPKNIGVSVLCPGVVASNIFDSKRNRTADYGDAQTAPEAMREQVAKSQSMVMPASAAAARVVEAVRNDETYIFTHVKYRDALKARFDRIFESFDKVGESAALKGRTT